MVSNVGRTLNDFSIPTSQRAASEDLGQEDFLKLMVEQMRNQNPLDPQDNSEFFSQIAQFQTLDAMNVISKAITTLVEISGLSNASSLIGRDILAEIEQDPDPETGFPRPPKEVTGTVDKVTFDSNGAVLHVGALAIPASAVVEISEPVVEAAPVDSPSDVMAELLAQLEALGVLGTGEGDPADAAAASGDVPATDEVAAADETAPDETVTDDVAGDESATGEAAA
jgi:flagellar basal-body rod modification protein FlgD